MVVMQILTLHSLSFTDHILRLNTPLNEGKPQTGFYVKNLQIYRSMLFSFFFLPDFIFLAVKACWTMTFNVRLCVVPPGMMGFIQNRGKAPSYSLYFFLGQQWPDPKNKPWEKKLIMVEVMGRLSLVFTLKLIEMMSYHVQEILT